MADRDRRARGASIALVAPVAASAAAWWPVRGAFFHTDDFIHLYDLSTLPSGRFLTQIWGGHLLVAPNAVFLALATALGPDPAPFFTVVWATHLVNVALLGRAVLRLTGDALVSGVAALAWGVSAMLEGTLTWYSVYGQMLLTGIVLVVLPDMSADRRAPAAGRVLAWAGLLAVGATCFGSGLGILAAAPLVAAIAWPGSPRLRVAIPILAATAIATIAVYAVLRAQSPDLDPQARALLAPLAILAGLPAAAAFLGRLLAAGAFAVVAGFVGAAAAPGWLRGVVAAVAAALAVLGWRAGDAASRRAQAVSWVLALAAYGTVAAGRITLVEFLHVPLSAAALWPRYHYLGAAVLAVALALAIQALASRGAAARRVAHTALASWAALRIVALIVRPLPIDLHLGQRAETAAALAAIHEAIAAAPAGSVVTIPNRPFGPAGIPWLFPGWAALFAIHFPDDVVDGRTVRFAASEEDWARAQARGGRMARLVVPAAP